MMRSALHTHQVRRSASMLACSTSQPIGRSHCDMHLPQYCIACHRNELGGTLDDAPAHDYANLAESEIDYAGFWKSSFRSQKPHAAEKGNAVSQQSGRYLYNGDAPTTMVPCHADCLEILDKRAGGTYSGLKRSTRSLW